jgi:hypothetical protein
MKAEVHELKESNHGTWLHFNIYWNHFVPKNGNTSEVRSEK